MSDKEKSAANYNKGKETREKILQAAREIFSENQYHTASIRTIAKIGGFDHQLIRYYYPNKAELFEAVAKEIKAHFVNNLAKWLEGIERMPPREGFPLYLDRMLEDNFKNPEALKIIALNSTGSQELDELPGFQKLPEMIRETQNMFMEKIPMQVPEKDIDAFVHSFNAQLVFFVGAGHCQALALNMEPDSEEYKKWVKETLIYIFLPALEKLIFPDGK
jgi:AcrR family transcriptional regulator